MAAVEKTIVLRRIPAEGEDPDKVVPQADLKVVVERENEFAWIGRWVGNPWAAGLPYRKDLWEEVTS